MRDARQKCDMRDKKCDMRDKNARCNITKCQMRGRIFEMRDKRMREMRDGKFEMRD